MPELIPGAYYQFKVSAVNSIGKSDMSSALIMIAATISDPPSEPSFIESGRTFISFGWQVTYDGGAEVDDFEIDWKLNSNSVWSTIYSTAG